MEDTTEAQLIENDQNDSEIAEAQKALSLALGQVRSEHLASEELFKLFSEPVYWSQLVGPRPCILVGGRGTGKTTTLRSLAFEGQSRIEGNDLAKWNAIGSYWRIESNVVTAFRGRGLDESTWTHIFSHYVNLQLLVKVLDFVIWRKQECDVSTDFDIRSLRLASISLNITPCHNLMEFSELVQEELARMEASLNGLSRNLNGIELSALGKPVEHLLRSVRSDSALSSMIFTFCVDEFENLAGYQQRVINTLVKHVGDAGFTFKIGMRRSIVREKATLAAGQELTDPADYTTVDIVRHLQDRTFSKFAAQICDNRLKGMPPKYRPDISIVKIFSELSENEEAALLGAERNRSEIRTRLIEFGAAGQMLQHFDSMSLISSCLVGYWAEAKGTTVLQVLEESFDNPEAWKIRLTNHSYAMLFTLRKGKRGIRKYYSGWSVISQIAEGNIRYLLRLVYEAMVLHVRDGNSLKMVVSPESQTEAAIKVGELALRELQGLSERGGQIMRLTLGLGRIYGVMAAEPKGHTPEVNQFRIRRRTQDSLVELDEVLNSAIMHGAIVAFAGDKVASGTGETKEDNFQLHPIFAPYFTFTHRSKRRIVITSEEFLGLSSSDSRRTIEKILKRRTGSSPVVELPEQLSMYSGFFNESI